MSQTQLDQAPRRNVWSDENGNYFGEGHIPPAEFKVVCLKYDVEVCGVDPIDEGCADMDPDKVRHEWWFQPDPDDDERMRRCDADHPGALPFTAWRRW
jgi:hypothetical protein